MCLGMTGPILVYGEVYGCRLNVLPGVGSTSPWSSWPRALNLFEG